MLPINPTFDAEVSLECSYSDIVRPAAIGTLCIYSEFIDRPLMWRPDSVSSR
jgi:hypothetical protein